VKMAAGRGEFFRSLLEGLERKPPNPDPRRGRLSLVAHDSQRLPVVTPVYFLFRLPSEILIKILSYLDVSSLFCISHVICFITNAVRSIKLLMTRSADDAAVKEGPVEVGDLSLGHWKRVYFRTAAGQEMGKWRRELRDISPYTGLPRQTEWVLRYQRPSFCLIYSLSKRFPNEFMVSVSSFKSSIQHDVPFFMWSSSVIVRWNGGDLASYHHISSIQLHGVRKEAMKRPRKPGWRSLILKLDMKAEPGCFIGKDRLIKLMHLTPGVIIGVWRGQSSVAFIMVSLHFHKLVEKSLLGSPAWPPVYDLDPEFGLHGYTLHFNCCIMTLTLLDEFHKPFWCVSSPICITMAKMSLSFDYSGEHFLMNYQNPEGQVKMKLVWLKEQKQFFLISLTVYVSLSKVNQHFSRDY
uniref:F-box domain-containing protein n=1 Tax=Echeneis naucrates TaxID=173247 RepID=A0A665UAI8_ECHNA